MLRMGVKEFHLPYTLNAAEAAKTAGEFKKAGLTIMSGGNISLQDEDPAALRRLFEYARNCGMPMNSRHERSPGRRTGRARGSVAAM